MRLPSLLLLFISIMGLAFAADNISVVKGSLYAADVVGEAIYLFESNVNSKSITKGEEVYLKELVEFKTLRDSCSMHLYFSNKMNIFFHKKGWLTIENLEHLRQKDYEDVEIVNVKVKGRADFILTNLKEGGFMSVQTDVADLEVKSKRFYVDSTSYNTTVECYDGELILTDSSTLKATTLTAGNYAVVFGAGGEKNTSIKISPLTKEKLDEQAERVTNPLVLEWKFKSTTVSSKP